MGSMIATLTFSALVETHLTGLLLGSGLLAAPSLSAPWAIVGFMVILGLLVTLSPSRRTYEVKRPKDE
jgi:hypothetical protein